MRYAKIEEYEYVNGEGWGVSLYTQGCPIRCKGCFNPETWDFNGGKEYNSLIYDKITKLLNKEYITRFNILGGEPLAHQNVCEIWILIIGIKKRFPDIKIWLWTGYEFKDLWTTYELMREQQFPPCAETFMCKILNNIDYLIAGPFIEEEKDLTLQWRGSRNQKVIDMKETFKQGEKVLYV